MEEIEARLRRELRRSTLVYLAFPNEDNDIEAMMGRLRNVGARLGTIPGSARTAYLRENLATYLVGVTYAAWNNYSEGTLWPHVEEALGHPKITQQELADFYRLGLDAFGLDRFQVREMRNVSEILVHSGIPRKSQATFLERLVRAFQKEDNLSAEEFNLRVSNLTRGEVAAKGFDIPTWRFISKAPAIAEDLTEKCLEVLDDIADNGEWDQGGGEGLPAPLLTAIVDFTKELSLSKRTRGRGGLLRKSPGVRLDPETFELKLLLPQFEQILRKPVSWKIHIGDEVADITAYPELRGLDSKPKEFVISSLAREIFLESDEAQASWSVMLFDPEAPISYFRMDGKALPDSGSLPGQEIIGLAPISPDTSGFQVAIDKRIVQSPQIYGPPSGWSEDLDSSVWRIFSCDLSGASRISLFQNGIELEDSIRYVGQGLPSFVSTGKVLEGFDHNGAQLYSSLPSVVLPAVAADEDFSWQIRVRTTDLGVRKSFKLDVPCSIKEQTIDLGQPSSEGEFSIAVQGKKGNSQRLDGFLFAAAVGTIEPPVRGLQSSGVGLEPCSYTIWLNGAKFASGQIKDEIEHTFITPQGAEIRVLPAHAELLEIRGSETVRHLRAMHLDPDALFGSKLKVIWPGEQLKRVFARAGEAEVQQVAIKDASSRQPYILLGELTDTASAYGQVDLFASYGTSTKRIANIRVKEIVSDCQLDSDGKVSIKSEASAAKLLVRIFCLDAPWAKPETLEIQGPSFQLPDSHKNLQRLGLVFDLEDPWVTPSWPEHFTVGRNSFLIDTAILTAEVTPMGALSKWFRDGVFNEELTQIPGGLFARLLLDDSLETAYRSREEVIRLAKDLFVHFQDSALPELAQLADSFRTSAVPVLFDLNLVDKQVTKTAKINRFNNSAPFLSLIAGGAAHWSSADWVQIWSRNLGGAEAETDDADTILGELGLLDRDKLFSQFVKNIQDIDFIRDPEAMPKARQRLGVLPSQPLHRSNLAGIFLNLLAARTQLQNEPMIRPYLANDGMKETSKNIRRALPLGALPARDLLRKMSQPRDELFEIGGNAVLIMQLSVGLALLARFSPREKLVAGVYEAWKPLHSRLAGILPDLVEHDLIVAELLASHHETFGGKSG